LGPLGTAATNRPIVPAPGDYDPGEIGGMIGRGNRSTWRKPASVPLCPPQTPHAARTRTRAAAVGSQRQPLELRHGHGLCTHSKVLKIRVAMFTRTYNGRSYYPTAKVQLKFTGESSYFLSLSFTPSLPFFPLSFLYF
jgi:hypothetical protein